LLTREGIVVFQRLFIIFMTTSVTKRIGIIIPGFLINKAADIMKKVQAKIVGKILMREVWNNARKPIITFAFE
jgi:hypothetical protein